MILFLSFYFTFVQFRSIFNIPNLILMLRVFMTVSYKAGFIDLLLKKGSLELGDRTLTSERLSPYFVNTGNISDGVGIGQFGDSYSAVAEGLVSEGDVVFGPAYKGIPLATAVAISLASTGTNVGYAFDRKEAKDHGEVTSKDDLQRAMIIGSNISNGSRILLVDDVLTTGGTKYDSIELLNRIADGLEYLGLIIGVDRQEVGIGSNALSSSEQFTQQTGIPVYSVVTASEIYQYLRTRGDVDQRAVDRMGAYLRVYGNKDARESVGKNEEQIIIPRDRSIVPACDIDSIEKFEQLVRETADVEAIGGYKVGFELGLLYSLPNVVEVVRINAPGKAVIYDHQKAGTDIPDTGKNFARVMKRSGVDAVIFFPQAGPETERAWIYHALDNGLKVIVGGWMTHPAYTQSEGGFILDSAALDIYRIAARAGVNNFVVPGTKPDVVENVRDLIRLEGIDPIFYPTGFVTQGGSFESMKSILGDRWHGIVGRAITGSKDMKSAALEQTKCVS